jgi:hypothetical protein
MKMITAKAAAMVFTLFLATGTASLVLAADGWETNLTITVAGAENNLSFGQRDDATDALDGQYDVPPMIGGTITSYFSDGGGLLWRDLRAFSQEIKSWNLHIESPLVDKYIYVTWDPTKLPDGARVTLRDKINGVDVNMANRNMFAYKNAGPKELEIIVQH